MWFFCIAENTGTNVQLPMSSLRAVLDRCLRSGYKSQKGTSPVERIRNFFSELLRRKVIRLMGAYVAILWLLATGLSNIVPNLTFLPAWSFQAFVFTGIALIPLLAYLSWKYDIVPPQLVRDPRDREALNPALSWAMRRHNSTDAGYLLLKWRAEDGSVEEKLSYQPVAIGREPTNDIELPDQRVSRHHAVLWAEDGQWHVRDIDSANGTFLDRNRVTGAAPLPSSCKLRFHAEGPSVHVFVAKSTETVAS